MFREEAAAFSIKYIVNLLFCTNTRFNIHGKRVFFNVNSAANGRKSAHPDLRVPENPVRKLKKGATA